MVGLRDAPGHPARRLPHRPAAEGRDRGRPGGQRGEGGGEGGGHGRLGEHLVRDGRPGRVVTRGGDGGGGGGGGLVVEGGAAAVHVPRRAAGEDGRGAGLEGDGPVGGAGVARQPVVLKTRKQTRRVKIGPTSERISLNGHLVFAVAVLKCTVALVFYFALYIFVFNI